MLGDLLDWANKRWRKTQDEVFLEQLIVSNDIRYPRVFEMDIEFINSDEYFYSIQIGIN